MKLIVDIKVNDLERAVAFYKNVLDLSCRIKEESWAAFIIGDAEIHLYLHSGTTGHVEFYVHNISDKVAELTKNGVTFVSGKEKPEALSVDENAITTFPWGKAAFFRDSENNELAIVQDNAL